MLPLSVCLSCLSVCNVVYCDQTVSLIKMKLGKEVGLGPGHIVLDGDPVPHPQNGQSPQLSAHVCCVAKQLDGLRRRLLRRYRPRPTRHSPTRKKKRGGTEPPILAHVLWPNCCMDQDVTCYGGRPQCVTWGPSCSLKRGTAALPSFRPMSVVSKWLDDQNVT